MNHENETEKLLCLLCYYDQYLLLYCRIKYNVMQAFGTGLYELGIKHVAAVTGKNSPVMYPSIMDAQS